MAREKKPRKSSEPAVRKSRLDCPKARKLYLEALAKGTARSAAAVVGLTTNGAARYRRDHPEFQQSCLEAEAVFRGSVEAKILHKALENGEWDALKFVAQCKLRWAHHKPDTITIKEVIILCNRIGTEMAASMPFESQVAARRIIDKHLELLLLGGGGGNGK